MLSRLALALITAGFILLGLASGYIFGESYSGKFIIPFLMSPGKHRLLRNEVVAPPNVAYNFQHNLSGFPDEVLSFGSELKLLRITGGRIKSVPAGVGSLTGLETLEISDNKLNSIPPEVGNLKLLAQLNLGGNELASLPATIGELTSLKKLSLYDNRITSLPDGVSGLSSLEILDLHSNFLSNLPQGIGNLTNLKVLYLGGNRLSQEEKQRIRGLLPNTLIFF